jgi:hypothetical protein
MRFWSQAWLVIILAQGLGHAEDSHTVALPGGGYFHYDFSWTYIGESRPNQRGAYDYYDMLGKFAGWSEATTPGQVDFFTANGIKYRTVVSDTSGTHITYDTRGVVQNIGTDNYRGGMDNFDWRYRFANTGNGLDYFEAGEPDRDEP